MSRKDDEIDIDDDFFDDDMDFNFDDDFDFNDRKPTGPKKYAVAFGKNMGKGVKDRIVAEAAEQMPNTADAVSDAFDVLSELDDIKDEVKESMGAIGREAKKLVRPALPVMKRVLPKGWYEKLDELTTPEERIKQLTAEQIQKQQREDTITGAIAELFQQQQATDTKNQEADKIRDEMHHSERLVDMQQQKVTTDSTLVSLQHIRRELQTSNAFLSSASMAFMKKSLELKYRHMFLAQDLLEASRANFRFSEQALNKVIHNTQLPESQKIMMGERYKTLTKDKLVNQFNNMVANVIPTMMGNIRKQIKNPMEMVRMALSEASGMMDQADDMGIDMKEMGVEMAGGLTGGKLANKPVQWLASMFGDKFMDAETLTKDYKHKLYGELVGAKSKLAGSDGFFGQMGHKLLESILPTHRVNRSVTLDEAYKNPNAPAEFDVSVRQAIVDVIPGYQALHLQKTTELLNHLKGIDGPVDTISWNAKTSRFGTSKEVATSLVDDIYNVGSIQAAFDRGMGQLEGHHRLSGKDTDSFRYIEKDLKQFAVNVGVEGLNIHLWEEIKKFATNDRAYEKSSTHIRRLFKSTKDPKALAQYIWDFQLGENGKVDIFDRSTFENIIRDMNNNRDSRANKLTEVASLPGSHMFRDLLMSQEDIAKGKHLTDGTINVRDMDNEVYSGVLGKASGYSSTYKQGVTTTIEDKQRYEEAKERRQAELYDVKQSTKFKGDRVTGDWDDWRDREIKLMEEALVESGGKYKYNYTKLRELAELMREYEGRESEKDPDLKATQRTTIKEILGVVDTPTTEDSTTTDVKGKVVGKLFKQKPKQSKVTTDTTPIVNAIKELKQAIVGMKGGTTTTTSRVDLSTTNQHLVDIRDMLAGQTQATTGLLAKVHAAISDIKLFNYHGGDPKAAGIMSKMKTGAGWAGDKLNKGYSNLSRFARTTMDNVTTMLPKLIGGAVSIPINVLRSINKSVYGEDEQDNPKKNILMEGLTSGLSMPWRIFNKTREKIRGGPIMSTVPVKDDEGEGFGGFLKRTGTGIGNVLRGAGRGIKDAATGAGKGISDIAGKVLPPSMIMGLEMARLGGHGLLNVGKGVRNLFTGGGPRGTDRIVGRLDTIITLMGGSPPHDDMPTGPTMRDRISGTYDKLKTKVGGTDTPDGPTMKERVVDKYQDTKKSVVSKAQQLKDHLGIGSKLELMQRRTQIVDKLHEMRDSVDDRTKKYLDKLYHKLQPDTNASEEEQLQAIAEFKEFQASGNGAKSKTLGGRMLSKVKSFLPETKATTTNETDIEKKQTKSKSLLMRFAKRIGGRFGKMAALVGLRNMSLEDTMKANVLATMEVSESVRKQEGEGKDKKGGILSNLFGPKGKGKGRIARLLGLGGAGGAGAAAGAKIGMGAIAAKSAVVLGTTAAASYVADSMVNSFTDWHITHTAGGENQRSFLRDYTGAMHVGERFGRYSNSFIHELRRLLGVGITGGGRFRNNNQWLHTLIMRGLTMKATGESVTPELIESFWPMVARAGGFKAKSKTQRQQFVLWYEHRFMKMLQMISNGVEGYNKHRIDKSNLPPLDYLQIIKGKDRDKEIRDLSKALRLIKIPDEVQEYKLDEEFLTKTEVLDEPVVESDTVEDDRNLSLWARWKKRKTTTVDEPKSEIATEPTVTVPTTMSKVKDFGRSTKDKLSVAYTAIREKAKAWLKGQEGLRLNKYYCTAGKPTIGYGHHMQGEQFDSITLKEAEELFEMDYSKAEALAQQIPVFNQLDGARQAALINMVFNMGLGSQKTGKGVLGFRNTLATLEAAAVAEDEAKRNKLFDQASKGILGSLYARQVGSRAEEVAEIISTGDPTKIKPKPINTTSKDRSLMSGEELEGLSQSKYSEADYQNYISNLTSKPTTNRGGLVDMYNGEDLTTDGMSTVKGKRPELYNTDDSQIAPVSTMTERYKEPEQPTTVDVHAELMEGKVLADNTSKTNELLTTLNETMKQLFATQTERAREEERRRVIEERRRPYQGFTTPTTPTQVHIPLPT